MVSAQNIIDNADNADKDTSVIRAKKTSEGYEKQYERKRIFNRVTSPIRKVTQMVRGSYNKTPEQYRSQQSYGGLTKKNVITSLKRISPVQGNFREGYRINRLPIQKRRMPGQPMIRPESVGYATRFVSGRSPPRAESKGYSQRGRPKGTYKYYIPGVGPAGVFEWRKYQRFKQRQLAMQLQQQSPNMSYPEARAAIQQVSRQIPEQQQYIQPQTQQMPQQAVYQQPQMPQPQFDDGWGLLRIKSPLSMTGNGLMARPVNPIANVQAPIGNPQTSYYSEPSFFGTQQVMRQRPNIGGFGLW